MADPLPSIDLAALHFIRGETGAFVAPPGSIVTFEPTGQFFEMRIIVEGRTVVSAVLHRSALKFCRAEVTP